MCIFFFFLFMCIFSQNAEMVFNFGATPFKHPPSSSFTALCEAPSANLAKGGAAAAQSVGAFKPKNNAPQAIIIEVGEYIFKLKWLVCSGKIWNDKNVAMVYIKVFPV